MVQIGQPAPNFKLVDINKNEVTLDQFKGKHLVLFFFPMAWTGVCSKEMCTVQEDFNTYAGLGAQVIGVSVDSHFALKRFKEDNNIEYPLLSDFNKQAIKDYDVVQESFAGVYANTSRRATFVIDKDGVLRYAQVLPSPGDFPDMEAIKAAVKALNA
jgi:peroxiredoxin